MPVCVQPPVPSAEEICQPEGVLTPLKGDQVAQDFEPVEVQGGQEVGVDQPENGSGFREEGREPVGIVSAFLA